MDTLIFWVIKPLGELLGALLVVLFIVIVAGIWTGVDLIRNYYGFGKANRKLDADLLNALRRSTSNGTESIRASSFFASQVTSGGVVPGMPNVKDRLYREAMSRLIRRKQAVESGNILSLGRRGMENKT